MEGRNHRNQAKHAFLLLSLVTYSLAHVPNSYSSAVNALESTSKEKESEFATNSMKSVDILKTANHDQIRNQPSSIQAKPMIEKQEDTVTDSMVQGSYEAFQKDENEVQITYSVPQAAAPAELKTMLPGIDDKALVNQVMSLMKTSKSNVDVITQAFRFVKLDAHLFTLLNQLSQMRESQDALQAESIKQQSKFDNVLEEIKSLATNFAKESMRLTEVEERLESELEMMNDRMDSVSEKIIQSSVSTQLLLDLSKETIQQTDKSVGISNEVLSELKSVRTELGDVGQASVQTIYNVQKLEESLLIAVEETGNKTIYALRQDQQLQYQLLPLASAMRVDLEEEASLVPLGNGSIGNSMQADGTVLPESTSLPAVASVLSSSTANTSETVAVVAGAAKNDRKKLKTQQDMQDTTSRNSSSNNEKSKLQGSLVSSSCSSSYEKQIEGRPRTCEQIQLSGFTTSGVYRIYPFDIERNGTEVYCDLHSDKGGWTVIQRRNELFGKRVDFERSWHEYAVGFGITHDSYWLGLNTISELTKSGDYEIQIELTDWEEDVRVAKYAYFRIANSSEKFRIHVADYSGNAGDSLAYHNGMAFTTKDSDNDLEKNVNCAQKYHGAWWYKSCHQSNLNGLYTDESNGKHESYANGVNWYSWHGYYYSLKRTEMKIRSRHFEAYLRESRE